MPEDQAEKPAARGWEHEELTALLADLARIVPQHGLGQAGVSTGGHVLAAANVEVTDLVREVMALCGEGPSALVGDPGRAEPDSRGIDAVAGLATTEAAWDEPCAVVPPTAPADTPASAAAIVADGDLWSQATFDDPFSLISDKAATSDEPVTGSLPPAPAKPAAAIPPPSEAIPSGVAASMQASVSPTSPAETRPAHEEPAAAPAPVELRAVDAAIAGGVDELLGGSFESVADVLSGVFEEHAAVVQDVERVLTEVPLEQSASLPPRAAAQRLRRGPRGRPGCRGRARAARPVAPSGKEPPPPRAGRSASQPKPQPTQAMPEVEPSAEESSEVEAGAGRIEVARLELLRRLGPALVAPLVLLSLPLQFVPPSVRPFVDWVALSLLLWVPIVWVAALFL